MNVTFTKHTNISQVFGFFESYITHVSVMVIFGAVSGLSGKVDYAFLGLTVHVGLVLVRFVSTNHAISPVDVVK